MLTREQQAVLDDLQERVDALELLIAKYVRSNGNGNGSNGDLGARRRQAREAVAGPSNPKPRWLTFVRWGAPCASCTNEIPSGEQPEPIYYVPGTNGHKSAMFHKGCAPANA